MPITGPVKLEIGCGDNPQPGYIHADIRPTAHVEYVFNMEKDPVPFPDNSVDELLTNHVLEHMSWRSLPFVMSEWLRVLKPGGRIFFRTPNLEFIVKNYIAGKVTPEHPVDTGFVQTHLASTVTPGWWANIKLFSGQDYPANFHHLCLDFAMAYELLTRYGFVHVKQLNIQPVFSPGELQIEAYKPIAVPIKKTRKIAVRRAGALGDTVLTIPIIRQLALENPDAEIHLESQSYSGVMPNPYITHAAAALDLKNNVYDKIYDLNLVYERDPKCHIIDAYAKSVFGHTNINKNTEVFYTAEDVEFVVRKLKELGLFGPEAIPFVVLHMGVTCPTRTIPLDIWQRITSKLVEDYKIIVIGTQGDQIVTGPNIIDVRSVLKISHIGPLLERAAGYIGNDSGLLHIAGAVEVPMVGLFTAARGEYRLPFRPSAVAVSADIACHGCHHDFTPPITFVRCPKMVNGKVPCVSLIDPDVVVAKLKQIIQHK